MYSLRDFSILIHELAAPLNGMLMITEAMERYFETDPHAMEEIGDLVGVLKKEAERLVLLLKKFRSSRVFLDLNLRPLSLATEIDELLLLKSAYYEQQRARVERDVPTGLPLISADSGKLRQILLNLCNNGVEAMPDGGKLTLRGYTTEEWVCLDISDTGDGIPEATEVFELAKTNKPQGTGLGLLIVREIIQQHNGTVSYTSRLGKGTTFQVKFPKLTE